MKYLKCLRNFLLITGIIFSSFVFKAQALVPVESLVLGDFSNDYSEDKSDPLNFVFKRDLINDKSLDKYKTNLSIYRGFYQEGKNLVNYCGLGNEIRYRIPWQKIQVKRSYMALLQYIGLDLAVRAIPQYAKKLEFTRDEYSNMVENLVGNYCSANLSFISKKELKNNLYLKFDKENSFELPSIKGSPLFSSKINGYFKANKASEQEFLYTVKIFQSLCSWNGNPENPGLMVPFLKHPGLNMFVARQMASYDIGWRQVDNFLFLKEEPKTLKVWCDNLLCRRISNEDLSRKYIFSIGGTSIYDDAKRLYCDDFRNAYYRPNLSDKRLAKMMNARTFDEENLMTSQFIALITGFPDFLVRSENYSQAQDFLRSSIDYRFDQWATKASESFANDLYFEEPLTLELIDRSHYINFRKGDLKVAFDINLGEFDRINQMNGKVKVSFNLKVQNSFLNYYKKQATQLLMNSDAKSIEGLKEKFKFQIKDALQEARSKFIIPPWKGDLEEIIVSELTEQIIQGSEKFYSFQSTGFRVIPIDFYYGIFALKYLNHQFDIKKAQSKQIDPK